MQFLRAFFPFSFTKKEDVKSLVIQVIIHVVAMIVVSVVCFIPIVALIVGLVDSLIYLYLTAGIVFTFLNYFKVGAFKD